MGRLCLALKTLCCLKKTGMLSFEESQTMPVTERHGDKE